MKFVGIDLGTTNSTVSIAYKNNSGDTIAKTLGVHQVDETGVNMEQKQILPSVVYFDDASVPYVGEYAKKMASINPKQVLSKVKRHMGKEGKWKLKNGEEYSPQQVSAFVLSALRAAAKEYYMEDIDEAVITVPASFHLLQQNATKEAAKMAGFDPEKIRLIPEPRAAILDFVNEEQNKAPESRRMDFTNPKNVMVFDIGGGTCDITIHRVSVEGKNVIKLKDLSISQYTELGGIDFDNLIAQALVKKVLGATALTPQQFKENYNTNEVREEILAVAERAKKIISNRILQQTLHMELKETIGKFKDVAYTHVFSNLPEGLKPSRPIKITREEIDAAIEPLLHNKAKSAKNIEQPILSAFESAIIPIQKEDIDCVLLVGGMSYYPTVRERIYEFFDQRIIPVTPVDPMTAISRGAAVYHYWRETEEDEVIYPQNVFINVKKGSPETLVKYGQTLPFKKTFTNFFVSGAYNTDQVDNMQLELFTAIDPESPKNTQLGKAYIEFKEQVRVGTPLTLRVLVDKDRNVTVHAWLRNDETQKLTVTVGAPSMSDADQQKVKDNIQRMQQHLYQEK